MEKYVFSIILMGIPTLTHVSNDICWLSQAVKCVLIGFFIFAGWTNMRYLRWEESPWVFEFIFFLSFFVLFSLYPSHKQLSRTLNVTVHFSLGRKMSSGLPAPLCQFPRTRSSGECGGSLTLKKTVNFILCCMMPAQVPTRHQPYFFITWLLLWELELLCW